MVDSVTFGGIIVITRVLGHFKRLVFFKSLGYLEVNQLLFCLGVRRPLRLIWYKYFDDITITVI